MKYVWINSYCHWSSLLSKHVFFCLTGEFFWSYFGLGWYPKVNCHGSTFYRPSRRVFFLLSNQQRQSTRGRDKNNYYELLLHVLTEYYLFKHGIHIDTRCISIRVVCRFGRVKAVCQLLGEFYIYCSELDTKYSTTRSRSYVSWCCSCLRYDNLLSFTVTYNLSTFRLYLALTVVTGSHGSFVKTKYSRAVFAIFLMGVIQWSKSAGIYTLQDSALGSVV